MLEYTQNISLKLQRNFFRFAVPFLLLVFIECAFFREFDFEDRSELGVVEFSMKLIMIVYFLIAEKSVFAFCMLAKYVIQISLLIYIYISVQKRILRETHFSDKKIEEPKNVKYISRILGYFLYYIIISGVYVSFGAKYFVYINSNVDRILAIILAGPLFYIVSIFVSLGPFFWIASGIDPSPEAEKTSSFLRLQKVFWRLMGKIVGFHGVLFVLVIPVFWPELVPWPEISLTYLSENTLVYFGIAWSQFLLVLAVIGTSMFVVEEYMLVTPLVGKTDSV